MAEEIKRDDASRSIEADDRPHGDIATEADGSDARNKFSVRQDSLSVPKPSYHKHIDEGAELGEPEGMEGDEWREAGESEPDFEAAAAARRERARKIRWWGILLLVVLYAAFRLLFPDQ